MKDKGLCFGFLEKGHMGKNCQNRMTCQICHQNHPDILHIDMKDKTESQNVKKESRKSSMSRALVSLDAGSHTGAGNNECKLSIVSVEVMLCKGTKFVQTYAFLDPEALQRFVQRH